MVAEHPGTVLVVSHDRDFLDRVATATLMAEAEGAWTEYAGGYSDMVAQRGAGVTARARVKEAREPSRKGPSAPKASTPRRKLGFKEWHDLKVLPARMAELDARIGKLQAVLADPTLYGRDPALFERTSAALTTAQSELSAAEDRWLALEMLREEIEG